MSESYVQLVLREFRRLKSLGDEAIAQVSGLCAAHLAAGGMLVLTSHQDIPIAALDAHALELKG